MHLLTGWEKFSGKDPYEVLLLVMVTDKKVLDGKRLGW